MTFKRLTWFYSRSSWPAPEPSHHSLKDMDQYTLGVLTRILPAPWSSKITLCRNRLGEVCGKGSRRAFARSKSKLSLNDSLRIPGSGRVSCRSCFRQWLFWWRLRQVGRRLKAFSTIQAVLHSLAWKQASETLYVLPEAHSSLMVGIYIKICEARRVIRVWYYMRADYASFQVALPNEKQTLITVSSLHNNPRRRTTLTQKHYSKIRYPPLHFIKALVRNQRLDHDKEPTSYPGSTC